MSGECCKWRSDPNGPTEKSRRRFLKEVFVGAAGIGLGGGWRERADAQQPPAAVSDPKAYGDYPMTRPRVYSGKNLEAVAMPIGGIGTGTIWLDGQGVLRVWQVFNNYTEARIPDSFFAVYAKTRGGQPVVRVLQTVGESGFPNVASLTFEGGYPIARLEFEDPELPVAVRLEGFNPMIPTDTDNSSLPCAIFRITTRNAGRVPVDVSVLGTLQNAVGSEGRAGIQGVKFAAYGGNRNRLVRDGGMTAIGMRGQDSPPAAGRLKVRDESGAEVQGPPLLWLTELGGPVEAATAGGPASALFSDMAQLCESGGGIVAAGVRPEFFEGLKTARDRAADWQKLTVFEDFESGTYANWTVRGAAFGKAPHTGTSPSQQRVSGFLGRRLVNTFVPNDGPQGELISKPFTIERKYIGFLIGGGNHPNETCINLKVDGQVVRTATGKDNELLEPASWDVSEFVGKQGVIEIIDHHSGGWGHINIDHIVFSDIRPEVVMKLGGAVEVVAGSLAMEYEGAEAATAAGPARVGDGAGVLKGVNEPWMVTQYTRLREFRPTGGYQVVATTPNGDPLIVVGPMGKARVALCLAPDLPWSWAERLLAEVRGTALGEGQRIVSGSPAFGTMALAAAEAGATANTNWTDGQALAQQLLDGQGQLAGLEESGATAAGQTCNGAIAMPFVLQPGQERTTTFVIAWHFPNVDRFGHQGNYYSRRFPDALSVARYVVQNLQPLWERTRLYHQTVYQSNLPEEFLDAMTSQSVIFRGPTCWQSESGYFAGYEGCYRCCPLNCTHVWNYAQTHARLFPEIGRNLRRSDLLVYLHEDGETSHRQHSPHGAFYDGHAAVIEATLREHQLSPDKRFLEEVWPNLKKATDWLIEHLDPDHDGVPQGQQPNTYDCNVSGANTFIGSQYLSALAAAERMAEVMGDKAAAARWRTVREAGMKNQNEKLWNGEYYIQIPETPPARDYNTGCHSDQLLGQWWAHQLTLGYLYPQERVRSALAAVVKYNTREDFAGFQQRPRRYVIDQEGGLLMCTWPRGGRPNPFILYADEVWTGIEYAVAGALIYEGMIDQARKIVRVARGRYDGVVRQGLNSGPGGNPFNELECGKFYARAMSSWSLLIACQGLVLDGPTGVIGFKPNWQPEDHRSFFSAPEGWGLFVQRRVGNQQEERVEVRHGRLKVRELVFAVPDNARQVTATVAVGDRPVGAAIKREGSEVRLELARETEVREGSAVQVELRW